MFTCYAPRGGKAGRIQHKRLWPIRSKIFTKQQWNFHLPTVFFTAFFCRTLCRQSAQLLIFYCSDSLRWTFKKGLLGGDTFPRARNPDSYVAFVHEVDCGWLPRLMCCDFEIGVDCALATYSGVELVASKSSVLPIPHRYKGLGMPNARGKCQAVVENHGVRFETTPDPWFSADDLHIEPLMAPLICITSLLGNNWQI